MLINPRHRRYLTIGMTSIGAALAMGYGPNAAVAQEVRCDMACTGSTCVATQIPCPKSDIAEKPAV